MKNSLPLYDSSFTISRDKSFRENSFSIFKLFFLLLLGLTLARFLIGRGSITFTGLLETFSKSPSISTDWIKYVQTNFSETFPFGFQWLGKIFDFFSDLLSVSLFTSVSIANVIAFILYFVRYIFL